MGNREREPSLDDPGDGSFVSIRGQPHVTEISGKELQPETPNNETEPSTEPMPSGKRSSRGVSFLAPVVALAGLGAVVVTMPPKFDILPDLSTIAELLPHETASEPKPDSAVSVALKDIQSAQRQYVIALQDSRDVLRQSTGLLQEKTDLLQQNTDLLLHQGAANLEAMNQGFASEQTTLKTISDRLSSLMARVEALQNASAPQITSSIPQPSARVRSTRVSHRRISRLRKPVEPVSMMGLPLISAPASVPPFGG